MPSSNNKEAFSSFFKDSKAKLDSASVKGRNYLNKEHHNPLKSNDNQQAETFSARPLSALKDPKSFPAPPVHLVAHGEISRPHPPPRSNAPAVTTAPAATAPVVGGYPGAQQGYQPSYQAGYQAGPPQLPPGHATSLQQNTFQPPQTAFVPPVTTTQEYQVPATAAHSFQPPTTTAVPQHYSQPPQPAYQATTTTAVSTPPLPSRQASITPPAVPVRAPLPDPSSFPKPPPMYGGPSSSAQTHTPASTSAHTFTPATHPALPPRTAVHPTPQPAVASTSPALGYNPSIKKKPPPVPSKAAKPSKFSATPVADPYPVGHEPPPYSAVADPQPSPSVAGSVPPDPNVTVAGGSASQIAQQFERMNISPVRPGFQQNQNNIIAELQRRSSSISTQGGSEPSPHHLPPRNPSTTTFDSPHHIPASSNNVAASAAPAVSAAAAHFKKAPPKPPKKKPSIAGLSHLNSQSNPATHTANPSTVATAPGPQHHQPYQSAAIVTGQTLESAGAVASAAAALAATTVAASTTLANATGHKSSVSSVSSGNSSQHPDFSGPPPPINYSTRPSIASITSSNGLSPVSSTNFHEPVGTGVPNTNPLPPTTTTYPLTQGPQTTSVAPTYPHGVPATAGATPPASTPTTGRLGGTKNDPKGQFDLNLTTLWFTQPARSIKLPESLAGLNYTFSVSSSGNSRKLILALRISEDLSIVKFKLEWQATDPLGTVVVERHDSPPPPALTQVQLAQASAQFGEGIARYAESVRGQQVGDGECWTLAQQAITHSCGGAAMLPQGYTHGAVVYHAHGGAPAPLAYNDRIMRGDIVQFTSGRFDTRNAQGMIIKQSYLGSPNHTSIVTAVSDDNRAIDVLHQNVGGIRRVQPDKHNLDELTAGEIKIFRPIWKEWAGELEAKWD